MLGGVLALRFMVGSGSDAGVGGAGAVPFVGVLAVDAFVVVGCCGVETDEAAGCGDWASDVLPSRFCFAAVAVVVAGAFVSMEHTWGSTREKQMLHWAGTPPILMFGCCQCDSTSE
jgi:hypothetical protein